VRTPPAPGRFEVLRRLGTGGSAEVLLARDRQGGRLVALKVPRPGSATPPDLAAEFARVSSLAHPGIAAALDYVPPEEPGGPCLVLEAAPGVPSAEAARTADPRRILSWVAGVAEVLDFLHGSGLLHGDLKPENVFVGPDDLPRLLDFGLARAPGERGGGTVATAAPEVLRGEPGDERSDLWSLGATLAWWLYGRPPAGDTLAVRLAGLDRRPALPAPPAGLGIVRELLRALLAPRPTDRIPSARALLRRLEEEGIRPHPRLVDPAARARSLPLAGREELLERLALALVEGEDGARFVALAGPAGAGHARIVGELVRRARLAGRRVIVHERGAGRLATTLASASGTRVLGASPAVLLATLARRAPGLLVVVEAADELPERERRELATFPSRLGDRPIRVLAAFRGGESPAGWDREDLPPLGAREIGILVTHLLPGAACPRSFLERLARWSGGRPAPVVELVLAAVREGRVRRVGEGWEMTDLAAFPLPAPPGEGFPTRALPPPGSPGGRFLGALAVLGLPSSPLEVARTAGLPAADAGRIVRELRRDGLLDRLADGRVFLPPGVDPLVSPDDLPRLHARALAALRGLARPDAAGGEIPRAARLARHALGAGRSVTGARLAALAVERALREDEPETAAAILAHLPEVPDDLPAAARAVLERCRGDLALARGEAGRAAELLEAAAARFERAGRPVAAALARAREGRARAARGDLAGALRLFGAIPRDGLPPGPRAAILLEEGVALALAGRADEAVVRFRRAARTVSPGHPVRARAEVSLGRALVLAGRAEEGLPVLRRADEAARNIPAVFRPLLVARLQGELAIGRPLRVLAEVRRALALLEERADADGLALVHTLAGEAHRALGEWEPALRSFREAAAWRRVQGNPAWTAAALGRLAAVEIHLGLLDRARRRLAEALRLLGHRAAPAYRAPLHGQLARLLALAGDAEGALRSAQAALALARRETPERRADARAALARALAAAGRLAEAATAARRVLDLVRAAGGLGREALVAEMLALRARHLATLAPREALSLARRARELADRAAAPDAAREALLALAEAHVHLDEPGEAERAREEARARLVVEAGRLAPDLAEAFLSRPDRATDGLDVSSAGQRLDALYEIVAELNGGREPREVIEVLLDRALELLGAERGAVLLARPGGGLEVVLSRHVEPETERDAIALSRTILDRARGGEAILAADPASDPRFAGAHSVRMFAIRAVLCVPLRTRTGMVGAVYVDSRAPGRRFTGEDLRFLEALAHHAALALENVRERLRLAEENERLRAQLDRRDRLGPLVGASPAMQEVYRKIEEMAPTGFPVLVLGESGTGKELVARTLHRHGPAPDGPFVAVNCAALPASILESTLFGHEKGAFTGADRARPGLVERAHGGTLFLDEIGELPPEIQAKFLRVLETREVQRLGAAAPRPVDFRLVAATNRDLQEEVREGRFREDLYYRLDVLRIALPPLRDRIEDLPLLVEHLLGKLEESFGPLRVHPETLARLASWRWPGNVRELENVLRRLALRARAGVIGPEALAADPEMAERFGVTAAPGPTRLEEAEREAIRRALELTRGHRERAARLLGIGRATLFRKIRRYGLGDVGRLDSRPPRKPDATP